MKEGSEMLGESEESHHKGHTEFLLMIKGIIPPTIDPTACKLVDMVIYIPRSCSSEYDIAIDPIVTNMRPADIPIATPAKIGNPLLPVWSKYIRLPT